MRVLRFLMVMTAVSVLAVGSALAQATPPAAASRRSSRRRRRPRRRPRRAPRPSQQAPRPYPEGAKIAYIDIQAVATTRSRARPPPRSSRSSRRRRSREITEKNKQLESAKTKQQTSATCMNDSARLALEKEIDKLTREVQFLQQEAQSERQALPGRAPGGLPAQAESDPRAGRQGEGSAHARQHQQRRSGLGRPRPRPDRAK